MVKRISESGLLLSLFSSILFSMQFPLIKLSLGHISAPVGAVFESIFTVLLCLITANVLKQKIAMIFEKELVFSGLLNAAGLILLFEGLALVHPGILGLIGRLYFVYAMLIAYLYFNERPSVSEIILIVIAICGVFLVSFKTSVTSVGSILGVSIALLYPLFFACQNACVKPLVKKFNSATVLFNTKIYALAPLAFYFFIRENFHSLELSAYGIGIILCSTFLSTFLGLLLFYRALSITTFRFANLMKATEPVFVLLFSCILFPVSLSVHNIIGVALILFSVGIVAVMKAREEPAKMGLMKKI